MASRPPLGIALSDQLGVPQPHYSKGQIIAGILADALAGAAGQPGPIAARWNHEREQQQEQAQWGLQRRARLEDWQAQQDYQREHPDPSPMERDLGVWQHMTPEQRTAYQQMKAAGAPDPDVVTTLPNGQLYAGPRSGLAQALMGGGQSAQLPAIGSVLPDPRKGGPTQPASGGFPTSYPNIGPYKRY
jgi:hypothetical protein